MLRVLHLQLKILTFFLFHYYTLFYLIVKGTPVTQEALDEVGDVSGVLTVGDDYLAPDVRAECERIIPDINGVKSCNAADTFLFLKHHYHEQSAGGSLSTNIETQ
jgi:hypothetical protein